MDIQELRREIDGIDAQLLPLFCQRMEIAAQVADYKKQNGLPIYVPGREREILDRVAAQAGENMADYAKILYNTLFELSRAYQGSRNSPALSPAGPGADRSGQDTAPVPKDGNGGLSGCGGGVLPNRRRAHFPRPYDFIFQGLLRGIPGSGAGPVPLRASCPLKILPPAL